MGEIEASLVDATWQEVGRIPRSRIPIEMGRASREQPDLLAFMFGRPGYHPFRNGFSAPIEDFHG